jgi:hypothetical protein
MKAYLIIPLTLALLAGCSQQESQTDGADKPKSSATLALEGITGKTAVDAGERAKAQINEISARREEDLREAVGNGQ